MKPIALALLLSLPAYAGPDGGWDVELRDAGTTLTDQAACMSPTDAQNLDTYLRATERDRDAYRGWMLAMTPIAVAATVAVAVLAAAYAKK